MAFQFIGVFSDAFKAVWKNKRLWLLHFVLNAVIVVASVLWLKIGDASVWQLIFAAIVALLLVVTALWLHGGTLAYFLDVHGGGGTSLSAGFKSGRRHLLAFAAWTIIFAIIICNASKLGNTDAFDSWLRSSMPAFLRRMISLNAIDGVVGWSVNFLLYVLIPGLLLPFAVQFANHGFSFLGSSFKAWKRTVGKFSYWLWFCILALLGIYLPNLITTKAPIPASLWLDHLSLVVRFGFAFALTITAWLVLTSVLGRLGSGKGSEGPSGNAPA